MNPPKKGDIIFEWPLTADDGIQKTGITMDTVHEGEVTLKLCLSKNHDTTPLMHKNKWSLPGYGGSKMDILG